MWELGLVTGAAGNVSRRIDGERIAITPSGIPYDVLEPREIVLVPGNGKPSYELPMHQAIYRARPDVHAIVHTHSPFVTALSVLRRPLPPVIDEMLAYFGGTIGVADYAFTGTEELGVNVVKALGDAPAVMLASHGNVCVARELPRALALAIAMEAGAGIYVRALQIGEPAPLPDDALEAGRRLYEERKP